MECEIHEGESCFHVSLHTQSLVECLVYSGWAIICELCKWETSVSLWSEYIQFYFEWVSETHTAFLRNYTLKRQSFFQVSKTEILIGFIIYYFYFKTFLK